MVSYQWLRRSVVERYVLIWVIMRGDLICQLHPLRTGSLGQQMVNNSYVMLCVMLASNMIAMVLMVVGKMGDPYM